MNENLTMIIVMPTFFLASAWALKVLVNAMQIRYQLKRHYGVQDKLVDRLGGSADVVEYLRSDAAQKILTMAGPEHTSPYGRVLSALQAGVVLSLLATGFLVLRGFIGAESVEAFTVVGVLGLCLGLGFIGSAAAAYQFSKRWGLIDGGAELDD